MWSGPDMPLTIRVGLPDMRAAISDVVICPSP
jgi:hypothetical protein